MSEDRHGSDFALGHITGARPAVRLGEQQYACELPPGTCCGNPPTNGGRCPHAIKVNTEPDPSIFVSASTTPLPANSAYGRYRAPTD